MADNVIELNGKRYDAITGAYLGASPKGSAPVRHLPKGRVIDGFIRPTTTNAHIVKPKPVVPATPKAVAKPEPAQKRPHADVTRTSSTSSAKHTLSQAHHAAAAAARHKPEHSHTLMRHAVHKPAVSMKPAIKPQAAAEIAAKPLSAIVQKRSALQVDEARMERAKNIAKHGGIRRFMPVRPDHSPAGVAVTPHRTPDEVPIIAVQPAPAREHHNRYAHRDIFEAAVARADSHKQPKHNARRGHRRLVNTLAVIGAFLVIGGFVTYLNVPNIQLRVASVQAGFKADIPGYKPTGFALQGGVKRTGNTVSLTYRSGESNYTITQQPSDWNSQTLAENTLALSGDNHKTLEVGGRIVYVYGGSNAVWVNGGVRYDLNTNAPLSTDDITRLATSL